MLSTALALKQRNNEDGKPIAKRRLVVLELASHRHRHPRPRNFRIRHPHGLWLLASSCCGLDPGLGNTHEPE